MAPAYSKSGCTQCKMRRKKCSEHKPYCKACLRHKVACSYDYRPLLPSERQRTIRVGTFPQGSPLVLVQRLRSIRSDFTDNESMLTRLPALLDAMYAPSCTSEYRDVPSLMQLTFAEQHVCDSMVACWSGILSLVERGSVHFDDKSWGRALGTVRIKISQDLESSQTLLKLLLSIFFLFALEVRRP